MTSKIKFEIINLSNIDNRPGGSRVSRQMPPERKQMNGILWTATMCAGCPKSTGWTATGWGCTIYAKPWMSYGARNNTNCPYNPKYSKDVAKKKINPLKASKRKNR